MYGRGVERGMRTTVYRCGKYMVARKALNMLNNAHFDGISWTVVSSIMLCQ